MEKYNKLWRTFYALAIIAIAAQQLICRDFRPVIVPTEFPAGLPARLTLTWIVSLAMIAAGIGIIFEIKSREAALLLGALLLLFVLLLQVPYELNLYPANLGVWTDPLKELTLSGGAFIVAGSLPSRGAAPGFISFLEKLIPFGKYFMAVTMIAFGIDHFLYTDFVATLVPAWLPAHIFCTYFAGVALILSGLAIILNIKRKLASALLGLMIFLWLLILHIPRAIVDPYSDMGNEWTSVFEALAFAGISFIIAGKPNRAFGDNP